MKKYDVNVETVTITKDGRVMMKGTIPVSVFANDRGGAILAGLDVGQALARSANCTKGQVGIYFRVTDVTEKIIEN